MCVYTNARKNVMSTEEAMRIQVGCPFWIENIRGGIKEVNGYECVLKRLVNTLK